MKFSKTPIGHLMSPEYITISSESTARQALDLIHTKTNSFASLYYVYILNQNNQLVGVCTLHELILQQPETPLYRFMVQNLVVIHLTTPEQIAIHKMIKYKLHALPVIDRDKKMIGMVTIDDLAPQFLHTS